MRRIDFIICNLLFVVMAVCGCKSHHSITNSNESVKDSIVYITRDSIVYRHDTTVITNVVKEIEQVIATSESTTTEWWDNYTREWTDSMGRIWKETYEKGNRQSSTAEQTDYIHSLQDSLLYYKGEEYEWRTSYDRLFKTYAEALEFRSESSSEPSKRSSWLDRLLHLLIGAVIGAMAFFAYISIFRKK